MKRDEFESFLNILLMFDAIFFLLNTKYHLVFEVISRFSGEQIPENYAVSKNWAALYDYGVLVITYTLQEFFKSFFC